MELTTTVRISPTAPLRSFQLVQAATPAAKVALSIWQDIKSNILQAMFQWYLSFADTLEIITLPGGTT